jgi:hypothetical protein
MRKICINKAMGENMPRLNFQNENFNKIKIGIFTLEFNIHSSASSYGIDELLEKINKRGYAANYSDLTLYLIIINSL